MKIGGIFIWLILHALAVLYLSQLVFYLLMKLEHAIGPIALLIVAALLLGALQWLVRRIPKPRLRRHQQWYVDWWRLPLLSYLMGVMFGSIAAIIGTLRVIAPDHFLMILGIAFVVFIVVVKGMDVSKKRK